MADQTLQVRIEGDLKNLQAALAQSKKDVDNFTNAAQASGEKFGAGFKKNVGIIQGLENKLKGLRALIGKATNEESIERLNDEFQRTSQELSRLNTIGKVTGATLSNVNTKTGASFNKLGSGIGNANGVAIEFNRIIQDAPFGVIGIGNNIQQLTQNFATLKAQSGSTGAAIKASLASLISPANLLVLGISLVTAAFTAYQMGAFDTKDATKEATDELEDYRDALDNVTKAKIEGIASGQKESQSLKLLIGQAQDLNLSDKVRLAAVRELKSEYPDYLGNLTEEQILTGNVGDAYDNLTTAIIAKAKAQAFSNAIGENALKIATLENQKIVKQTELEKARTDALTASSSKGVGIGQDLFSKKEIAEAKVKDILKEQAKITAQISVITKEDLDLTNRISQARKEGATFTQSTNENLEETVEITKKISNEFDKIKRLVTDISSLPLIDPAKQDFDSAFSPKKEDRTGQGRSFQDQAKDNTNNLAEKVSKIPRAISPEMFFPSEVEMADYLKKLLEGVIKELDKEIPKLGQRIADLATQITDLLRASVPNAIADIGFSIGEALASGENVIGAIGKSLLSSIGTFLGELGQLLIQYAVAGISFGKLTTAIMSGGPQAILAGGLALAAGIALVAISGAISARAKGGVRGGGGGGGGFSGGSGSTFANAQAPSSPAFSSIPVSSDFQSNIIVYGRLDGNDILLSSQRSAQQNKFG